MIGRILFAVLLLFAAAACHRSAQSPSADAATGMSLDAEGEGARSGAHDPSDMTAIDVATGDLSGWSSYAGDRAVPVVAAHYGPPQAATNQTSDVLEGSVADADETVGEQTRQGPSPASAVPEDQAIPSSAGSSGKNPTAP